MVARLSPFQHFTQFVGVTASSASQAVNTLVESRVNGNLLIPVLVCTVQSEAGYMIASLPETR